MKVFLKIGIGVYIVNTWGKNRGRTKVGKRLA